MSQSRVLADQIFPQEGIAADAVRIAAATILLALCAHIVIPLPWTPVPITGQTFGVLLVGVLLGARRGGLALVLYLLEGAAGLPVFQPLGLVGPARFLGPTAGYLISYPFAAFVTGWMAERGTQIAGAPHGEIAACRHTRSHWRLDFWRGYYFCGRMYLAGYWVRTRLEACATAGCAAVRSRRSRQNRGDYRGRRRNPTLSAKVLV